MTPVISMNLITHSRDHELIFSGKYTDAGDPVMRKTMSHIVPGQMFDLEKFAESAHEWRVNGVVREPSETELAFWESLPEDKQITTLFDVSAAPTTFQGDPTTLIQEQ